VANSDVDTDDIIRHAATVLAKYKCPKRVFVVDSLPRNSMGKLRRSVLAPPLDTTGLDRAVATLWKASLS
jgi:malonyl-CoA/methylmalonyl-CoA synthetase